MEIWGCEPDDAVCDQSKEVLIGGCSVKLPSIPAKYVKFVKHRKNIYREINNMSQLGEHENVLQFLEVLELVQDSKCTIFLVLELAHGGELFDRIKIDCGTEEEVARRYFQQLLSGVGYCHNHGVCHRDLKPENLLLASTEEGATLKIADFGLSAVFLSNTQEDEKAADNGLSMRRLTSVVGSPHYVAPEILENSGCNSGYDGTKSDVWSLGVIMYAMLAGNLPFGKDLLHCKRFTKFSSWVQSRNAHLQSLLENSTGSPKPNVVFPQWFFPQKFSDNAKDLISKLLQPDPSKRMPVEEARRHPWIGNGNSSSAPMSIDFDDDEMLNEAVLLASMIPSGESEDVHRGLGGLCDPLLNMTTPGDTGPSLPTIHPSFLHRPSFYLPFLLPSSLIYLLFSFPPSSSCLPPSLPPFLPSFLHLSSSSLVFLPSCFPLQ
jgi:serine/threonine protein kinase